MASCPGAVGPDSAGSRFGKTHTSYAPARAVPGFICSDVALVTYVTSGTSFLKTHTAQTFFLIKTNANNNHIWIHDVLARYRHAPRSGRPGSNLVPRYRLNTELSNRRLNLVNRINHLLRRSNIPLLNTIVQIGWFLEISWNYFAVIAHRSRQNPQQSQPINGVYDSVTSCQSMFGANSAFLQWQNESVLGHLA